MKLSLMEFMILFDCLISSTISPDSVNTCTYDMETRELLFKSLMDRMHLNNNLIKIEGGEDE